MFAAIFFLSATGVLTAQQDDPSEIFLKAYLSAQQGEKVERESLFKTALAKYRFAGSLIEGLRRSHPNWQPAIVEYRGRKISEAILRIQQRMAKQNELNASATRLPEVVPTLPESESWSEPGPEALASQSNETISQPAADGATKEATKKFRDKVDQLTAALDKTRSELETAQKEKQTLTARLTETGSKLAKAEDDLKKANESAHQARNQLTQARESLNASRTSQENSANEQQQLRAEIARLKDTVAAANGARATAEKQRGDTEAKVAEANKQITALEHQRDEALAELNIAKQAEQHLRVLVAEKDDLQRNLANAEQNAAKLGESDVINTEKFAELRQQVELLQQQLSESQKRNDYLAARNAELDVELEHTDTDLQAARLAARNTEESEQLTKENELLRNIIVRERQEETRRDEARKLVLAELDKLKIRSDALNRQIEFLGQPITKLSTEELALLRQPVLSVSDQQAGLFKTNFVFATGKAPEPGKTTNNKTAASKSDVPAKFQGLARAARNNLDQRNYRTAEKQYQEILKKDPNNFNALSNLGMVYYRSGNLSSAESTLEKALVIAPDNEFVLTTIGIVHYRQSKFDAAIVELRKAVDINPKSATAHNYLAIAASQKGRQEEAEKEILQALANNPDDADAHFNLAVILITTQPASRELARQHYFKATALGIHPSPSLEKLLQ